MQPLLVTGFEAFGEHDVNPSERVVRALRAGPELVTEVLPVSYRRAEARLGELIEGVDPRAVLLLGLHGGQAIRLERIALNLDDAKTPDRDGEVRIGEPISAFGPAGYASTLPLDAFAAVLRRFSLPFEWSRDAGGFLCNHAFYVACDRVALRFGEVPCGFVHLPPLEALPIERQLAGVVACLEILRAPVSRREAAPARAGQ